MSNPISAAIRIGTLGELHVQLRLFQFDVQAAPPLKDSGNDWIAVKGPRFQTIQVKTTATRYLADFPDDRIYSLLVIVRFVGDDRDIRLDESEVYLIPRENLGDGAGCLSYDRRARAASRPRQAAPR